MGYIFDNFGIGVNLRANDTFETKFRSSIGFTGTVGSDPGYDMLADPPESEIVPGDVIDRLLEYNYYKFSTFRYLRYGKFIDSTWSYAYTRPYGYPCS